MITESKGRGADRTPDDHSTCGAAGLPLASFPGVMSNAASSDTTAAQSEFSAMCRPGQILRHVSQRNAR
jgi:hypothetical protein